MFGVIKNNILLVIYIKRYFKFFQYMDFLVKDYKNNDDGFNL